MYSVGFPSVQEGVWVRSCPSTRCFSSSKRFFRSAAFAAAESPAALCEVETSSDWLLGWGGKPASRQSTEHTVVRVFIWVPLIPVDLRMPYIQGDFRKTLSCLHDYVASEIILTGRLFAKSHGVIVLRPD
jgi:hypothetical protein